MSDAAPTPFSVTDNALARIAALIATEEKPAETVFRVAVQGGGCSGFQYHFDLEAKPIEAGDLLIEKLGARVVIDETSLEILAGSHLDYVSGLVGSAFEIKNPNATASCGCGNSFSM